MPRLRLIAMIARMIGSASLVPPSALTKLRSILILSN